MIKKVLALIMALMMTMGQGVVAFADPEVNDDPVTETVTGSIAITNVATANHSFSAYQIFSGDYTTNNAGNKILSNIAWGRGVDITKKVNEETLIQALAADEVFKHTETGTGGEETSVNDFKNDMTASDIAEVMTGGTWTADDTKVKEFAEVVSRYLSTSATNSSDSGTEVTEGDKKGTYTYVISDLPSGYYVVLDNKKNSETQTDPEEKEFYSAYIVQVVGADTTDESGNTKYAVTIATKGVMPTVDKQVQDENTNSDRETGTDRSADGWGETADHFIGEEFKFKLIANIPDDADIDAYETYKLVFHDTMSKGVAFVSNDASNSGLVSVRITEKDGNTAYDIPLDNSTGETVAEGKYKTTASTTNSNGSEESTFEVTVSDLKKVVKDKTDQNNPTYVDIQGATVEVVYKAKLTADCKVDSTIGSAVDTDNQNKVYLEYSNNPRVDGTGKTPEDTVFVFTYQVNNKKYKDEAKTGNELASAKFILLNSDKDKVAVFDANNKFVNWADYTDDKSLDSSNLSSGQKYELTSGDDGNFNMIGLDVGTYYIHETEAPGGYNKAADAEIELSATHAENASKIGESTLTLKIKKDSGYESATSVNIIDKPGSTLPSTGGIGTTIFYVVGGVLVVGAAILLVAKKRMN